ncbi:MAG: HlyD family efflux transporter periplasmic adaptor subunit [Rikenellaceae bacterium]|nr:HlyD family efflux transporter periplasmic adaptor subunit [Rikenellaceae bacterium]
MDRHQIKKRSVWYRYRYYMIGGIIFLAFVVFVWILSSGGQKLRVDKDNLSVHTVKRDKFMEYIDVDGIIEPHLTLKVNPGESGSIDRIIATSGQFIEQGDTIVVLINPELLRTLNEEKDAWEKQLMTFREKEISIEKQNLNLRKSSMKAEYDLERPERTFALDEEEYKMGAIGKAAFELKKADYDYQKRNAQLESESLRQDSITGELSRELLKNDRDREERRYRRAMERINQLVVLAPTLGQLSGLNLTPGQQVSNNTAIAEIKVLEPFKITTQISEYYDRRIVEGQAATATVDGVQYPLVITRVVSEMRDRNFPIELVFDGSQPEDVRIGRTYRVKIELNEPEDAVIIPRGDFFQQTGGQWIFKVNESGTKASRVPIRIGRQNPQTYEVIEGLTPGDRIITSGYSTFGNAVELLLR